MEERTMNHESRTKEFEGLGFEEAKILRSFKQPEATLIVDLGLREEELLKRMHEKTRYNIRLAERKGVKVVNDKFQMTNDKFDEFYGLMQQTAERDGIRIVGREYYEKLFQQSSKEMNVELFCAEHEGKMLAAAVVIFFGDIATYLYGASGNEQRNLMAPYALHWEIMKEAKKRGMRWYDLWGITSLFARHPDPPVCGEGFSEASHLRPRGLDSSLKAQNDKHDWSGITRFKRGFVSLEAGKESGREVLYPGAYDYILRKAWYRLGIVGAGLAR